MATPEVDRLHAIEPWDPRVNDATTEAVRTVGDKLHLVADLTARAAADLGMNGATAEAVAAELDALTKRVRASADGMHAIAKSRTTVTTAGRHAQDTSKQLQKDLKLVEKYYKLTASSAQTNPLGNVMLAQAEQKRAAAHAKLEARASTELASLDHVAVTEGKGLPFRPEEDSAGRRGPADSDSASGTGGGGRSPHVSASGGAEGPASSEPGQNMGLPRSATEWRATGLGDAVGSPGHAGQAPTPGYVPGAGSGFGLQGSHYAPQQPAGDHSGAVFGGPARPSGLSSPAVYDPLAAAAATTAGGVIGYKAVQAVRAAKAAPAAPVSSPRAGVRSGAAVRAAPARGRAGLPAGRPPPPERQPHPRRRGRVRRLGAGPPGPPARPPPRRQGARASSTGRPPPPEQPSLRRGRLPPAARLCAAGRPPPPEPAQTTPPSHEPTGKAPTPEQPQRALRRRTPPPASPQDRPQEEPRAAPAHAPPPAKPSPA